jgi:hypothetical protein
MSWVDWITFQSRQERIGGLFRIGSAGSPIHEKVKCRIYPSELTLVSTDYNAADQLDRNLDLVNTLSHKNIPVC